jgi:hypothetical protein
LSITSIRPSRYNSRDTICSGVIVAYIAETAITGT